MAAHGGAHEQRWAVGRVQGGREKKGRGRAATGVQAAHRRGRRGLRVLAPRAREREAEGEDKGCRAHPEISATWKCTCEGRERESALAWRPLCTVARARRAAPSVAAPWRRGSPRSPPTSRRSCGTLQRRRWASWAAISRRWPPPSRRWRSSSSSVDRVDRVDRVGCRRPAARPARCRRRPSQAHRPPHAITTAGGAMRTRRGMIGARPPRRRHW